MQYWSSNSNFSIDKKFSIFSVRKIVKSINDKFVVCKKFNVKSIKSDPHPLSVHRIKDLFVFEVTRIDFAGPVYLCGQQNGWICWRLFISLVSNTDNGYVLFY